MLPQETLSLMKANSVKSSATFLAAPASLFKRWVRELHQTCLHEAIPLAHWMHGGLFRRLGRLLR